MKKALSVILIVLALVSCVGKKQWNEIYANDLENEHFLPKHALHLKNNYKNASEIEAKIAHDAILIGTKLERKYSQTLSEVNSSNDLIKSIRLSKKILESHLSSYFSAYQSPIGKVENPFGRNFGYSEIHLLLNSEYERLGIFTLRNKLQQKINKEILKHNNKKYKNLYKLNYVLSLYFAETEKKLTSTIGFTENMNKLNYNFNLLVGLAESEIKFGT